MTDKWPRLMRAVTAASYVDEKSVESFRRGVGTIYPSAHKIAQKGDRWLRDDLDVAIERIAGQRPVITCAATIIGDPNDE